MAEIWFSQQYIYDKDTVFTAIYRQYCHHTYFIIKLYLIYILLQKLYPYPIYFAVKTVFLSYIFCCETVSLFNIFCCRNYIFILYILLYKLYLHAQLFAVKTVFLSYILCCKNCISLLNILL